MIGRCIGSDCSIGGYGQQVNSRRPIAGYAPASDIGAFVRSARGGIGQGVAPGNQPSTMSWWESLLQAAGQTGLEAWRMRNQARYGSRVTRGGAASPPPVVNLPGAGGGNPYGYGGQQAPVGPAAAPVAAAGGMLPWVIGGIAALALLR